MVVSPARGWHEQARHRLPRFSAAAQKNGKLLQQRPSSLTTREWQSQPSLEHNDWSVSLPRSGPPMADRVPAISLLARATIPPHQMQSLGSTLGNPLNLSKLPSSQ